MNNNLESETVKSEMEESELKKSSKISSKKSILREILEWASCVIIAVVLALIVRYYIGTPTIVQHPSMTPTLVSGDRLFLNRLDIKLGKGVEKGDIITFEAPSKLFVPAYQIRNSDDYIAEYNRDINGLINNFIYYVLEFNKTSYIKRVIAVAGEHIKIENGIVYINDKVYEEPYLPEGTETTDGNGFFLDLVVPEGTVFVMGDNRGNSTDSRCFGCVPIDKIESKVLIRFWPFDKFGEVQ